MLTPNNRYKIGDVFVSVKLEAAQEMLGLSAAKVEQEIVELEEKLEAVRDEMTQLKVELYSRFGKTINLEV
jgi:prefoldin subunit 4